MGSSPSARRSGTGHSAARAASIQPQIYFNIDRNRDRPVVSLGRSESPFFEAIHGCIVQTHAKRPHNLDLRLATNLYRLGVKDKTIQATLRHSNLSVTMNAYVKSVGPDSVAAMQQLESLYASNAVNMQRSTEKTVTVVQLRKTVTALELSLLEAVTGIWRRGGDSNPR